MNESMEPDAIGDLIVNILNDENPKLRYQVGPFMQKASATIKKVLPGRVLEES